MSTKIKLWVVASLALLFINSAFAGDKKVLLIGIDGMQYRYIDKLATPGFDRLQITKAYAGGVKGKLSEQSTSSGPGWSTVLTGVWVNKHGINNNKAGPANRGWSSIFRFIYEADRSAKLYSFSTWGTINTRYFPDDMRLLAAHSEGGSDDKSLNLALDVLQQDDPDFIFLHLDEPDAAGHKHGWGPEYELSITDSDARLSQLLDEIDRRENQLAEDWLVLVVTDHGRKAAGGDSHGGQSTSEKTTFIASNKPLNQEYKHYASVANQDFSGLYNYPAQTYVVPTILEFLGINDSKGYLDGLPLVGTIGISRIYSDIDGERCGLQWDADTGEPSELNSHEHVAKFDCEDNADPLLIQEDRVYTNIYGSSCELQWDSARGEPDILSSKEHLAKFDCSDISDKMIIDHEYIYSSILGSSCGFEWHARGGEPDTVNSFEHVAKFDCKGTADPLIFEY